MTSVRFSANYGHCSYVVSGSFALLDEKDPVGSALDRVRESIELNQRSS